jgi:hypothetical protein
MQSPKIATLLLWLTVAVALSQSVAFAQSPPLPLTNGANHSGSIALAGEFDRWTFSATAGDAISLSIGEVLVGGTDPGFNPWMRLYDPNGTLISPGGSVAGALVADIDLRASLTGTYTVRVEHANNPNPATGVGEYLLTLARAPGAFVVSDGDEGGEMTNGANHPGKIHRGDLDQWSFTAAKDDAITLKIGEVLGAVDPGFDPWIRLRGPNGATLASVTGALVAEIDVKAPLTGTYTVVVASYTVATDIGEYLLTLAHSPSPFVVPAGDEGGPMTNGANHAGKIHRGDLDQWSFDATKDDAISLSIGQIPGGAVAGFSPWIRLRGPDGANLGLILPLTAPATINVIAPLTGTYTVVAASFNVHTGIGEYLLTLAKTPGPFVVPPGDEGGPMTNGANHPGKIHPRDLDQWSFTASKDDAISVSIGEILAGGADPGFNPLIRLRGPDGATLGLAQGELVAAIDVTAPLTGTYTVVVASFTVPTGIGEYLLTLAQTPGAFVVPAGDEGGPMTNGVNHPGVIHRGDLDQWTFIAAQGTAISVGIAEVVTGADPGFDPWIRLRGPNGADLGSFQGPLGAVINVTAPLTGTYTVVVASHTVANANGSYLLQVAGAAAAAAPTTVNDVYSAHLDTPLVIAAPGVLSNDNSNGGGPITAELVTTSTDGTLTLNADGAFTYTPTSFFVGTTTFTYRAINSVGTGSIATVTITVNAASPPTAINDAFTMPIDIPSGVRAPGVLANDSSNGGGPMSAVLVTSVSHGALTLNGDGSFIYSPNPGFSGADSFTYRAANASGPGNTATVSITVSGPPTAQPPTGLIASSIVGNVITFRWDAPLGGLLPTDYVVEGGLIPGQVLASLRTDSAFPIYTITAPSGAFYVRVHTISGASRSEASNEIRVFINVPSPPSAPANLVGVVNGSSLSLAWRNTFAGGAPTSVMLDVTGAIVGSLPLGPTDTATFPTVPAGTYTIRLRATNAAGASAASNPVTLTFPSPCSGAPLPPANFLAYKIGNTAYVIWDPPLTGRAPTSYVLNVGGPITAVIPTTARSLHGVVPPGTYNLSVAATNACGTSASTPVQVLTMP